MKKYWYIACMLICTVMISSCSNEDDDIVIDEEWKQQNDDAFEKIATDPGYTEIKSISGNGSIYYKVLKEGTGTERIFYTSIVTAYFIEKDIEDNIWDKSEIGFNEPRIIYVQPGNQQYSKSEGYTVALQQMKVGDRWEIWIPYQLGYGLYDNIDYYNVSRKGASTIHLELEVKEILDDSMVIKPQK